MSSTPDVSIHPQGADFSPATTSHSTEASSLISQKDSNTETESKETISSIPLQKSSHHDASQETLSQQDAEELPSGTEPEVDPIPDDVSRPDIPDNVSETSDGSLMPRDFRLFRGEGNFKLETVARELQSMSLHHLDASRTYHPNSAATYFANHLKMMNWISEVIKDSNRPPLVPPSEVKYKERKRYLSGKIECKWREWVDLPQEYAIEILIEEEPLDREYFRSGPDSRSHAKPVILQPRDNDIKVIPSRISINSLAVKRVLSALSNGALVPNHPADNYTIYRPFKVLQWLEPKIRERLSEIQELCLSSKDRDIEIKDPKVSTEAEVSEEIETKDAKPAMTRETRDNIIFTSAYDWKSLTQDELQEASDDLGTLVSCIDEYILPLGKAVEGSGDVRIHYQELWHVFKPGSIVYVKDPAVPQKLWRVVQGKGGQTPQYRQPATQATNLQLGGALNDSRPLPFVIECYHIDFDGVQFIRVFKNFKFEMLRDLTSIRSLPIIPLRIAERDGFVDISGCKEKGQDFISYTRCSYSYYRGQSLIHEPEGTILRRPEKGAITSAVMISEAIESPVVVDFHRCLQEVPSWKPGRSSRGSWGLAEVTEEKKASPPYSSPPPIIPPGVDDDRVWDARIAEEVLEYTDQSQPVEVYGRESPEGDEILLLPNRVFAFVLRTRQWACIPLGSGSLDTQGHSLTRMGEDKKVWDYLQIDDSHRTIIKSLMATHFRKKKSERRQFDIIQDKGKGLIVLLHGVPGVGKTSTAVWIAETVAAYYNKPLLPITCGDLGMTPTEVESNLQNAFQMAQAWDCVLLLDEADVFLAERSQDNIERNALVSVFLRVMEYYEGILFLTTNKVGSFDEAFKSRMSMALYYPPLTHEQTKKIWEVQMDRTEKLSIAAAPMDPSQHVTFKRDEIVALSTTLWNLQTLRDDHKPVWNGRQIRNAFQTAVALAEFHQQENNIPGPIVVKGEHFEKVAKVSHEFNAYLYSVRHERLENELAHKKEHRYDDFNRNQLGFGGQGLGVPQQGGFQQGFGMPGGFQNLHQLGMMGMGMPNVGMAGSGFNNLQNQGNAMASHSPQAGFGNMNNVGMGMGNINMGMANAGLGNVGLGSAGSGGSNAAMGAQQSNTNNVGIPGQTLGGQMTPQQQQQLQELLRLQQQQQQ
ncbi:hypothetical protein CCUS01_17196 [Colletotrichum cuscutae]|uniref:AAA+ ATPase domain-containing protein n=1 Tax=Colletotrichum cuscutae TaxID=1209917 RepID=A0AAI9Y5N5_9PEZI|nr:hypothetical protein CCUS01_17196 [Colletotrichum cuscutae]